MALPRSLLLITIDCMRADHASFLGYPRPTTPFLDSLAPESWVFGNAIAAGAPTYYSFPAIMASRYALALGRDVIGLAPGEPTLATALSESGYANAAFVAANPYLSPRFGYDAGFDTFRDFLDSETGTEGSRTTQDHTWLSGPNRRLAAFCHALGPLGAVYDEAYFHYCLRLGRDSSPSLDGLRRFPAADVVVNHAQEWLAGVSGRPFFLWLHFMDPHAPYYPPESAMPLLGLASSGPARARYLNEYWNRDGLSANRLARYREEVMALYDAGIRWVDEQVARLVKTLRNTRLWERCIFAVTADHGEEFLDHGGRFHSPPSVTEEIIRVPLLLRIPQMQNPQTLSQPFSLLDFAPTLLDALEAQIPGSFRGRSRWKQLQAGSAWEDAAIAECVTACRNPFHLGDRLGDRALAVREADYKLVFDPRASGETLFDLSADSGGLHPLPPNSEPQVRRRLLDRARRHIAESLQSRDTDTRLAARLRDFRLEWAKSAPTIST